MVEGAELGIELGTGVVVGPNEILGDAVGAEVVGAAVGDSSKVTSSIAISLV